ncbi:MAG: formate/nitrite transporter family protein [bacterium]
MFKEDVLEAGHSAMKKVKFINSNPLGYFLASMLAGIYVGLGIMFIFTIGGMIHDSHAYKVVMGASFGIALSLVSIAGAELFTGNTFTMTIGTLLKEVTLADTIKVWVMCYLGNLAGSVLLGFLFFLTGAVDSGYVAEFFIESAEAKMTLPPINLFARALLCNILVCLATWCGYRCKSESGKLIMTFWCLYAFITSGYEHSVANMSLFTVALLSPLGGDLTLGMFAYNLTLATLGNMVGGILFLAVPYYFISKE